jgi:hypothetical protein
MSNDERSASRYHLAMATKRSSIEPAPREPVAAPALAAALRLFVAAFVVEDKRTQIATRLGARERRLETLTTLPRWLAGRTAALTGADRSPAGLQARFGALPGIHLDERGAARTTIVGALEAGRAAAGLFIGDSGRLALVFVVGQAPLLVTM